MKKVLRIVLGFFAITFIFAGIGAFQESKGAAVVLFVLAGLLALLFFKVKPKKKSTVVQGAKKNAKAALVDFFKTNPRNIIVLDLETNGLKKEKSVLAVGAIKYSVGEDKTLSEKERFVRYYFAREREDPSAIIVNGLTKKRIEELRGENCAYPKYFYEDFSSFTAFCSDCLHYVIFNAKFDMQFIKPAEDSAESDWHVFDVMTENTNILCLKRREGDTDYKFPSLKETLDFYGIEKKSSRLHTADYDAEMTAMVLKEMIKRAGI